jgi:hypothetical protein
MVGSIQTFYEMGFGPFSPQVVQCFRNLRVVRLGGSPFQPLLLPNDCPILSVSELDIRWIAYMHPYLMKHVVLSFPNVEVLRLGSDSAWCGLCNLSQPIHFSSPMPIVYEKGTGLPVEPLVHEPSWLCLMIFYRLISAVYSSG